MGEGTSEIRADIERTRDEMGDTVQALGYKTDVKSRARDKVTGALVEDQITEGIPTESKGEHAVSADEQASA